MLAVTAQCAITLPLASKPRAFSAKPMAASRRASKFLQGRECGPPSGCLATTSLPSAGPSAAKSTSWKILAKSPARSTVRSTARVPAAQRATPQRPSAFPQARISQTIFISTPSSGNPARYASTSIRIFTPPSHNLNGPPAAHGPSIIPFSSSSTSPSAAVGPVPRMPPPISPSKCLSTTSASTLSNSPLAHPFSGEGFPFIFSLPVSSLHFFLCVLRVSALKLLFATFSTGESPHDYIIRSCTPTSPPHACHRCLPRRQSSTRLTGPFRQLSHRRQDSYARANPRSRGRFI